MRGRKRYKSKGPEPREESVVQYWSGHSRVRPQHRTSVGREEETSERLEISKNRLWFNLKLIINRC